eukprot:s5335_g1.t3
MRISAVDGRNLSLDSPVVSRVVQASALARAKRAQRLGLYSIVHDLENELVNFDDHLTEGAVACALSHHAALQKVANDSSADWGLILEDDVSLVVPDVDRSISTILEQLPAHWSAVFLGYHDKYGCPHRRSANSSFRRFDEWAEEEPGMPEVEPVFEIHDHNWGLYAWMVKKEAARLLVEELFPISSQVDYAISRFLITQCGGVFSVHPDRLLFFSPTSQEGQDSDIQTMRAEEAVLEEFGSWEAYLEAQRELGLQVSGVMERLRPSSYGEYDAEDFEGALEDLLYPHAEEDVEEVDQWFEGNFGEWADTGAGGEKKRQRAEQEHKLDDEISGEARLGRIRQDWTFGPEEQRDLHKDGGSFTIIGQGGQSWLKSAKATRILMYPNYKDATLLKAFMETSMEAALSLSVGKKLLDMSWLLRTLVVSEDLM